MEKPWAGIDAPEPVFDQRRVILAGIDPADRQALDGTLAAATEATRSVRVECPGLRGALEEIQRCRGVGALPAIVAGSLLEVRDLVRLARALGSRKGTVPVVVVLAAPLRDVAEAALDEGCCDVLVRGRLVSDELVRALRHAFEVSRRQRAEERLQLRVQEVRTGPALPALPPDARRFVSLGRTLAAAGHELNNLLQPIVGYAELLVGSLESDTRAAHYARQVERSGRLAAGLVRRLLLAGRETRDPALPAPADARLGQLADLVQRVLGPAIELKVEPGAREAWIAVREGLLEQVLLNLAVNGRDALPLGGRMTLRTRAEGNDSWVLEVEGTGATVRPGEPRLVPPRPESPTDHEEAAGFGLWLVRGLIEDAGGTLLHADDANGPLRLTLRLPLVPDAQATQHLAH